MPDSARDFGCDRQTMYVRFCGETALPTLALTSRPEVLASKRNAIAAMEVTGRWLMTCAVISVPCIGRDVLIALRTPARR